jgi:predicted nucleotidyltransferase
MNCQEALALLRAHEAELRQAGVESLRVFGSVARDEAGAGSDVDIVVRLKPQVRQGGFSYYSRLDELNHRIAGILGGPADIIAEPVRKDRLRKAIEREAVLAF